MTTMAAIVTALQLVPLHQVDGRVIYINPADIITIAVPRQGDRKTAAPGTACVVFMTDNRHWQVLETCSAIKQMIEK